MSRQKHHYTDELELKSLLIRIKNMKLFEDSKESGEVMSEFDITTKEKIILNKSINNDIGKFVYIKNNIDELEKTSQSKDSRRRFRAIQEKLKERIVAKSERVICDKFSYERFGEIIILMIKNILRKPNFSHEYCFDDFYSDAYYKIIKYVRNFDHQKISKISGYEVNAFAYISQIIHNSIIHIIQKRKSENLKIAEYFKENPDSDISYHEDFICDSDIQKSLDNICPLEKPYVLEDSYPFIIKDLLWYIESYTKTKDNLLECILEYSVDSGLGQELVGDAIRNDEYLIKFIRETSISSELNDMW